MAHPDALTAARNAFTQLQDAAAAIAADTLSPMAARETRAAMPELAEVVRTAALVSIAESLHTLANRED
ncbi:hypothetical protein GCM10029963_53380 [Micromonospora andamanensis]|uniref:hypothetical protein n=1 Tax=Micromonospora andamanensis TaxID=1287068 RepID=UPI001951114C|nr:hypothetical protein [Micromonospora andamanensis]GIJ36701.1 hypothetical protein Vwe01_00260 [Micromonospora andamanensis]